MLQKDVIALVDGRDLISLVQKLEGRTLDFKARAYSISSEEHRAQFIKDILCMANTPREEDSHIILGVKKHPDGSYTVVGLDEDVDEADLQSQLSERVHPIPHFSYDFGSLEGKRVGVISIPPRRVGPSVPTRDFGNTLHKGQVYFRRGSKNDTAFADDLFMILDWIRGGDTSEPACQPEDVSTWTTLLESVHEFDPSRRYVLISSPLRNESDNALSSIGKVPWAAVFDFDPDSEQDGMLSAVQGAISTSRHLHYVVHGDRPHVIPDRATHWFFARGLCGRETTLATGPWKQWVQKYSLELSEQLRMVSAAVSPLPVTCIVLAYDTSMIRHLQSCLDTAVGAFGEAADFVIVTKHPADLQGLASEVDSTLIDIPLGQFCSGLEAHFSRLDGTGTDTLSLPSSSGAPVLIDAETRRWLEEDLELIHLDVGQIPPDGRDIGRAFLMGAGLDWYEAGCHEDVERDKTDQLKKQLQTELRHKRSSRVNLYHAPGAGGSTIARRTVWDLHKTYPSVILLRATQETAERLFRIASLTGQAVLVLSDGAMIAERSVNDLVDELRSRQVPAVILQVLRRFRSQLEGERAFYLPLQLTIPESYRFVTTFSKHEPGKRTELEFLVTDPQAGKRTAFYFGLQTFGKDFRGLEPYVAARLAGLKSEQKQIMCFLALAHHYAQRSMPAQAFAGLLGLPRNRTVNLRSALPEAALELLVQDSPSSWRTVHEFVAQEVLAQLLLPPGAVDRESWRYQLSRIAVDFAELCRGDTAVISDELLELARRTFIYRDNTDLLGTERSAQQTFAQLIEEIPKSEGRLHLLKALVELFPAEAHFWAHLGRFYAIGRKEYANAVDAIDHAIQLQPDDHVLYHMKGMALREQMHGIMKERADLTPVVDVARQASEAFEAARKINSDSEHSFISEVQLLASVLDYAARETMGNLLGYLALPTADRYVRFALERAEDLLEHVRRHREGEGVSQYFRDCRAHLDRLYGKHDKALQTWGNLLTQQGIYHPPLRRQMVWTYLARRSRSWDLLEPNEVRKVVDLLEENLEEEPHNDKNLRLWVQAVRRSQFPPSSESVIERVSYWKANSDSLDAVYYLYVLNALVALDGSGLAREETQRYLEECRTLARFRHNRTKSIEWLGHGTGLKRLVYHSELGEWDKAADFWEKKDRLVRVKGRISRYDGPQAGQIELAGGLQAFFVPARGGFTHDSVNHPVEFFLGFSYDGLRAWEVTGL